MPKVIVVGDKDTHNDTMQSQSGTTVYAGSSGGIGSAAASVHGVMADQDEVTDNPTPAQMAEARAEAIAGGATDIDSDPSDSGQGGQRSGVNTPCGSLPSYPGDSYQLSPNFTLGMLSSKCVFPYRVAAQGGLSLADIVCNLKALCVNILEPMRAQFPHGFRVNSGFRVGSGKSQHLRGQASDVQWAGISNQEYLVRAQWIRDHLPFDQLIMEHSPKTHSIWIHTSYNRNAAKQRGEVLTMIAGRYPKGLKVYY